MFGVSFWKTLQKNSLKKSALCFLSIAGIPCRFTMLGITGFFLTHARYFCILLNSRVRKTSSSNCVMSASTSIWISFDNRFILSSSLLFGTPVFLFPFNVSPSTCEVGLVTQGGSSERCFVTFGKVLMVSSAGLTPESRVFVALGKQIGSKRP